MASFDLSKYETVETRIAKFYAQYPDGRIVTDNVTTANDRERGQWIVKAYVYLSHTEQVDNAPKATGYAFETDGGPGANKTAALENAETSAIGRALANMGLHGSKRASREEMVKASRPVAGTVQVNWAEEISRVKTVEAARSLYALAVTENVAAEVLAEIAALGESLKA